MSHWWRAHDEAVDDPKLQLIPDSLFRAWFNVMCLCSANEGVLPPVDQVAFKLRMTQAKASKVVDELVDVKLLDLVDGKFQPHNWNERQFKSDVTDPTNAERQKRYRKRHAVTENVTEKSVTVTPPREQIADTERKKGSEPNGSGAHAPPSDAKADLFRRGREVLGKESGALIAKLLRSFGQEDDPKVLAKARARLEEASTKAKPAEWLGRVMAPKPGEFKLMSGIEGVV